MQTILKAMFKWFEDLQQTEDVRRHSFAMINGILIAIFIIIFIKYNGSVLIYKNDVDQLRIDNHALREHAVKTDKIIESLKFKDESNEKIIDQFYEIYERDHEKQESWNKARSNVTNANIHLYVEEVVLKYVKFESEGK